MHLATPSRRALGLAAVGAIAMSTTLLSLGGVAQAAPAPIQFTAADSPIVVQAGYCTIDWTLVGGSGGADGANVPGAFGGKLVVTTAVQANDTFTLYAGTAGGAGTAAAGSDPAVAGAMGVNGSGTWNGENGTSTGGGGGGAASTVDAGNSTILVAFGGDGAGADANNGNGGGNENYAAGLTGPAVTATATTGGAGSVTGTIQPCAPVAPGTPTVNWIEAGNGTAQLQIWSGTIPQGSTGAPVYEYSLDGGAWKPLVTGGEYQYEPTITGLTNGQTYSVRVQVTVDGLTSAPTVAQTVTPYVPIGAPGNVSVTHTATGLRVTWTASTVTGTHALAGYKVGWSGGMMGGGLCTTAATVLTCDVPADKLPESTVYWISVAAVDADGNNGVWSADVPDTAIPSTVPTKTGDLATTAASTGAVVPGQTMTITGAGFAPDSPVTVVVYSQPQVLTTTVADANGRISVTVTVPAGLAAGNHTLVATGVDALGNPHNLTLPITVTGGTTGSGGLAYTGASVAVPALGGLAALTIGGGLVLAGRRKRIAE